MLPPFGGALHLNPSPATPVATDPVLRTRGLGKDYGPLTAVQALDLNVHPGEIFGFLGPNGAGKTTAISMICGVITPSRGDVTIGGLDARAEPFAAKRLLGLVPQDLAIYEDLSARDNLRFFGRLYGLRGTSLDDGVRWVLDVVGLADRADEPVAKFSGGMKRRLNLAAGLVHRPRLLVLDEPTVGVDPQSRSHIFDAVRRLRDAEGMTVVYTSHYMEEVEALCSRVAILDHGTLVALDGVDALKARHGAGVVEIELERASDAGPAARSLSALGEASADGTRVRLRSASAAGPVVRALEAESIGVVSIALARPSLETVFLSLTGRHLRDDA